MARVVPDGWSVEQRHDADFNGDGRDDAVLLLREAEAPEPPAGRMLLVALATGTDGGYVVEATNDRIVPRPSGALEDPMANGGIEARPGEFDVTLGMMSGTGTYQASTIQFVFRYQPDCVQLIRYVRADTQRATLDTRDVAVDFLSGEVVTSTGNAGSGATSTQRSGLDASAPLCLPELPSGWTFDPLGP